MSRQLGVVLGYKPRDVRFVAFEVFDGFFAAGAVWLEPLLALQNDFVLGNVDSTHRARARSPPWHFDRL